MDNFSFKIYVYNFIKIHLILFLFSLIIIESKIDRDLKL